MRLQFKQFVALTRLTALEVMRQPICLLLTTSSVVFIGLLPVLIMHLMGEEQKLVRDSALALHFVGGLVLAGYAACAALQHEIRRGTVASVLSKPVGRGLFFLAKFSGVAVVLLLFSLAVATATLLSARVGAESYRQDWWAGGPLLAAPVLAFGLAAVLNYFTQRPFVSTAFGWLIGLLVVALIGSSFVSSEGVWAPFGSMVTWRIVPASVLISMALLVLAGVAVSLATRLDTVPTLSVCSVLFLVGLMSDYILGRQAGRHRVVAWLYSVAPNWQHFWMTDALSGEGTIPWGYVARVAGYALFYLAGVLCLGILAFRRMEVKT